MSVKEWKTAPTNLISNYHSFCRNTALNPTEEPSVIKMMLANMKSVDHRAIFQEMFPANPFIEWEYIDGMRTNCFGDSSMCIFMVYYLSFPEIDQDYKMQSSQKKLAYLTQFFRNVVEAGIQIPFDHVVKMLLLFNMKGVTGNHILEQYTCQILRCPTKDMITKLISFTADYRFGIDDYSQTVSWILQRCKVHPQFFNELQTFIMQKESIASAMKMKHLEMSVGRPRLMSKLSRSTEIQNVTYSTGKSAVIGEGFDSFQNWVTRVRFPNTISQRLKRRLYFTMSQPHINHTRVVKSVTTEQISGLALKEGITRPDAIVLGEVIEGLSIQRAPFPELTLFIRSCFRAFPQKDIREMTLLKYMQLYIASYQHKDLWKQCWVRVHPLLSYQVIKDVEDFVAGTPFNQEAFIDLITTD